MALRGDELDRGAVVGGYRIDQLIGRGGMGLVYRATNVALNRIYALKVLAPAIAEDDNFRQRFLREMRIAASLHHPNIVAIHYAGEQDGLIFFVMDYITGTDLREILQKEHTLEPARAVDLLAQLASALDAAHGRGLVHRDVKPANVLITVKDGEEHAYLTDFGLAKKADNLSGLTVKGTVVGTVHYMAPEQINGERTDARTDIYALGCVFFQMLSGKVPYDRENSVATMFAHLSDPAPPLIGEVADRYPMFDGVLEKALAKDPSDRYLSAGDFARDAAAALKGMRDAAPPTIVATGEALPHAVTDSPAEWEVHGPVETTKIPEEPAPAEATIRASGSAGADPGEGAKPRPKSNQPTRPRAIQRSGVPEPAPQPTPTPVPVPTPAPAAKASDVAPPRRPAGRYAVAALIALVIAGVVVAVVVLSSGSSKPSGQPFAAGLDPVPTNQVTGTGRGTVRLNGDVATVSVETTGLLNGSPHAMHIHAGGLGECPPASAATLHNGHLSISTTDGIKFYGPPQVSLTSTGDTSPKSIIDFSRYPSVGTIRYSRTITIPPGIAAAIRAGNAAVIVHGIDYNHNGIYDNVLDRSELNNALPGESTAPALCGVLAPTKTATASGQRSSVTYAFVLHRAISTPVAGGRGGWLLCHLSAADAVIGDDRRNAGVTST